MSRSNALVAGVLLLMGVACREDARPSYVIDGQGRRVAWRQREIVLEVRPPSPRTGITAADLLSAVAEGSAAWRVRGAPVIRARLANEGGPSLEDGLNVLQVRHDRWCPFEKDRPCYDENELAHTTPFTRPLGRDAAEVIEADIQLNAVHFRFDRPSDRARLRWVVQHEMGHVLGLGHVCGPASRYLRVAVPCTPAHETSTMHPTSFASSTSTEPRPSRGDLAALSALYSR